MPALPPPHRRCSLTLQSAVSLIGAVAVAPGDPAAHFGLGMTLAKLGRDEEARQAYARARAA